jgi:hypothetical protein
MLCRHAASGDAAQFDTSYQSKPAAASRSSISS